MEKVAGSFRCLQRIIQERYPMKEFTLKNLDSVIVLEMCAKRKMLKGPCVREGYLFVCLCYTLFVLKFLNI